MGAILHACATALADKLIADDENRNSQKAIYTYGFELLLSSSAVAISIFILSVLLGKIYSSIVFSSIFVTIRLFSGGFHAKTYGRCFIFSNLTYLICLVSANQILLHDLGLLCPILATAAAVIIFVLTPIKHKNHPLSDGKYKKNQRISRALTVCICLVILTSHYCFYAPNLVCLSSVTLVAVAVLMIIPKIHERGEIK